MKNSTFQILDAALTVLGHITASLLIGLAYLPSFFIVYFVYMHTLVLPIFPKSFLLMTSIGISYFIGGYILMILVVLFRILFISNASPGQFHRNSLSFFNFGIYHGMLALVEFTIMPLVRGTFIMRLFYIGMGAKIGRNTRINTNRLSDCDLVEIGDNCVIGGDVLINGHSGEGDVFLRNYVKIGNNVTIGSFSMILPGAIIEDNVIVGANSVVVKDQRLLSNNIYAGSPARILKANSNLSKKVQDTIGVSDSDKLQLDMLKRDINYSEAMLSSYQKLSNEISIVENHVANITVTSLGLVFTIVMYSILNQISVLASLPPLVFLSAGLIISTTSAMLKVAFKMAQIEVFFQMAGASHFNWETKWGIFGKSRISDLDGILIFSLFAIILTASLWLTFSGRILDLSTIVMGFFIWKILLSINIVLALWLVFSVVFLIIKTKIYKREINVLQITLSSKK